MKLISGPRARTQLECPIRNTGPTRRVDLTGARKAARRVGCLLQPGERLRHSMELSAWTPPLAAGTYELRAIYAVSPEAAAGSADVWRVPDAAGRCADAPPVAPDRALSGVWTGTVESAPIHLRVEP